MGHMIHASLQDFCHNVGSDSFSPGGGCVSALSGALAASLGKMVLTLTVGKKKYADFDVGNRQLLETMGKLQTELMQCVEHDKEGCDRILLAMAMPKDNESEKTRRRAAMSEASKKANEAPLAVCDKTVELLRLFLASLNRVNRNALTDWACGALQAYAALEGAAMNAKINLGSIDDTHYTKEVEEKLRSMLGEGRRLFEDIRGKVHSSLDSSN